MVNDKQYLKNRGEHDDGHDVSAVAELGHIVLRI